ncbi:MAG: tetratricopeptide repeat protein [bacterium]|nr:tetratricopeptide repeat protein [bacterium]
MQIKKKLTRKQFLTQDDEVMSFMKRALIWVRENVNLIIFAAVGLVIVVAVIWGVRYQRESNLRNSAKLLAQARADYYARVEGEPTAFDDHQSEKSFKNAREKYTAAMNTLDQVLKLYPSSASADDALFLKAEAYYNLGEYDKAILTYKQYLEKYKTKGAHSIEALSSIGYSYEAKGEYKEAARAFQKILDDYQGYLLRDNIYMELGRCYEQMKEFSKAKEAYQKLVANFSDSPLLKDAQNKLNLLNSSSAASADSHPSLPQALNTNQTSNTNQTAPAQTNQAAPAEGEAASSASQLSGEPAAAAQVSHGSEQNSVTSGQNEPPKGH